MSGTRILQAISFLVDYSMGHEGLGTLNYGNSEKSVADISETKNEKCALNYQGRFFSFPHHFGDWKMAVLRRGAAYPCTAWNL